MNERTLTDRELTQREIFVKSLKKRKDEFKDRYGDRWKEVIYATATKMAKEEHGAGEEGTSALKQKYTLQTPGQENKMKFKDLKNKLNENGFDNNQGEQHDDVHYLEQPGVQDRLNASMHVFSHNPSLDVWKTMTKIRVKLNSVGLDFNHPSSGDPQPKEEYQLTGFGGRWGWDGKVGDITSDDGIEHRAGSRYVLQVGFESTANGYVVNPTIQRVDEFTEDHPWHENIEDDEPDLTEGKSEETELELFLQNDSQIYRSRLQPIHKNLVTKIAQDRYDEKKAVKAFMYAVEDAAKKYVKEYDAPGAKVDDVFDKKTRTAVAERLASAFKDEVELGNYDDLLPKKYRS